MDILIFSDDPNLQKRLRKRGFLVLSSCELKKTLVEYYEPVLIYLDQNSFAKNWDKTIRYLTRRENILFAILDPKNKIKNLIDYLHSGMVDYVPAAKILSEPNDKSLKKVFNYLKKFRILNYSLAENNKKNSLEYIPVLRGWEDIKEENEYSFYIMFVELDEQEEMEKRYDRKNLDSALTVFQNYIERHIIPASGRIWLWSRFGGIVLFPFLENSENFAVLCCFKIMLYKYMHDVEESYFPNFISFRIALHLGNLLYKEKNKGEVVADSINTIFHLGQRFAEPGQFYCTKEAMQNIPESLKAYFKPCGNFENRTIYRMKQLSL